MQKMYQQPSCLAHPFCTDGSGTGLLAPCLQTDSGNRNTQWPSVLCQHIGPNRTMFLPLESTNPFSIFIAWLNLDFGIEGLVSMYFM